MDRFERIRARYGVWALAGLLVLSLLPILLLGWYDRASLDDYCYGLRTHQALMGGTSFLAGMWSTVSGYYQSWQGSFSSMTLMTLTPCVFSERAYWVTPVVMLLSLCAGTIKLMDTIVRRGLGGSRRQALCISLPVLLLSVQCVKAPLHTFYWWNGAVYYTFTYGVMLLFVERLAALRSAESGREIRWALLPALPAGVLVGGGNYVSALLSLLLSGLFLLWFFLRDRKKLRPALAMTGVLAAAFLVSVLAPGNVRRQSTVAAMSPAGAVLESVGQAWRDVLAFPNWLVLLTFLLLVPLLYRLTARTRFRFPWPAAFSVLSFLLFAAQNVPHFYAVSIAGPERLRSIVYYSFFWFLLANEWYWLGWFRRAVLPRLRPDGRLKARCRRMLAAVAVLLVLWTGQYAYSLTSVRCVRALADGSAAAYAAERDARLPALEDPAIQELKLAPIRSRPPLLYNGDVAEDPEDWRSKAVSNYFGKKSVVLSP